MLQYRRNKQLSRVSLSTEVSESIYTVYDWLNVIATSEHNNDWPVIRVGALLICWVTLYPLICRLLLHLGHFHASSIGLKLYDYKLIHFKGLTIALSIITHYAKISIIGFASLSGQNCCSCATAPAIQFPNSPLSFCSLWFNFAN